MLRHHPAVLDLVGNGLGVEIEVEVRVLFADHVLMGLKDQGGHVFFSGRRRLDNHDVADFVRAAFQAAAGGKLLEISRHRLFMARLSRNLCNLFEK